VTRRQLEHLLRAAGEIAADDEIVVIGSQAILGQFPDAPASMRVSVEADLFPRNLAFLADAARHRLASAEILLERLATVEADPATLDSACAAIQRAFRGLLA
jgi:hypothetical protein